jgi:predicted acyl esterase
MATDTADDMDVFVGVYKFDAAGNHVPLAFYSFFEDGPVALGWLRASHRELDPQRSTEFLPVLKHKRELKLTPGAKTPLDIEIWPSGTQFAPGERLRLIVQGTDLQKYSKIRDPVYFRHEDSVNAGQHTIHTGEADGSYLQVPVVPAG